MATGLQTDGKYSLWARAIRFFYGELQKNKLAGKLSVVGPDAAIWTADEAWYQFVGQLYNICISYSFCHITPPLFKIREATDCHFPS